MLCNHHIYLIPKHYLSLQNKTLYSLSSYFQFSPTLSPWQPSVSSLFLWTDLLWIFNMLFSCSVMSDSLATPWTAACQASLSFTIPWSLLKLMSIVSVMPSNHLRDMKYVTFCVQLLNIMFWRFIYFVSCISISLFLTAE